MKKNKTSSKIKWLGLLNWYPSRNSFRVKVNGKQWYSSKIAGNYPSEEQAEQALAEINGKLVASGIAPLATGKAQKQALVVITPPDVVELPPTPTQVPPVPQKPVEQFLALIDIEKAVKGFLNYEQGRVNAGEITLDSWEQTRFLSMEFQYWFNRSKQFEINASCLLAFRNYVLDRKAKGEYKNATVRHLFRNTKKLVNWLYECEQLDSLPRCFKTALKFNAPENDMKSVETFSIEQIKKMLAASSDSLKLYILLGLNCGMGFEDIATLKQGDFDGNRIIRGRNKTGIQGEWLLWTETKNLLNKLKDNGELLLTDKDGEPLTGRTVLTSGKVHRWNHVKAAFRYMLKVNGLDGTFYMFRKTGANMVKAHYIGQDNPERVAEIFLAHKPHTVAQRHYLKTEYAELDKALQAVEKVLF